MSRTAKRARQIVRKEMKSREILMHRYLRLLEIIKLAAAESSEETQRQCAEIAQRPEFRIEAEEVESLPNNLFREWLALMESGVPERYRHLLKERKHWKTPLPSTE